MLIERMRRRLAADRASFIEPCLPSPADKPPSGFNWIHEIKHDGYRLMVRRDPVGIRLITRRGHDWSGRYPLVVEAVNHLKVRSCLIDGEVVCCDERGLATFQLLRYRESRRGVTGRHVHFTGTAGLWGCLYSAGAHAWMVENADNQGLSGDAMGQTGPLLSE
jgi:ATP-dependent DNA ligase